MKITQKKLNLYADDFFKGANKLEKQPHFHEAAERMNFAGLALRKWALELKKGKKA